MRRPLGAMLALGLLAGAAPAAEPTVEALVRQLNDPAFATRDAATKALAARGADALPAVEKAAAEHADPETRQRAAAVAALLKRSADGVKLVAPKKVKLDLDRVPLGTAVAHVKGLTGVPLTLDQAKVADPLRAVTVHTDELPSWEAIEAFLQAAGLKEEFRAELGTPNPQPTAYSGRRQIYYGPGQQPITPINQVPVVLADGKATVPGDRSTAVRVLALPPGFAGNRVIRGVGHVVINLDVTPLSGVKWDDTSAVRVTKAEDETGRPVTVSHRTEQPRAFNPYGEEVVFLGGAQMAWAAGGWDGEIYPAGPPARLNPRVVPVTLKTDDRAIKTLRVFEGSVVGEVTIPNQTLAALDNLPKATGLTAHGPNDSRYSVVAYTADAKGKVLLKVRVDCPNPWTMQRLGRRMAMISGPADGRGLALGNGAQLQFKDATGKALPTPSMRGNSSTDDGIRQSYELDLEFPSRPGYGAPMSMTAVGNKPATVEVTFKLKNVPLP